MLAHQRFKLAAMFALCLPHCFDAPAARRVGMGGLRQEVGPNSGRPFRLCAGQAIGPTPDFGGPSPVHSAAVLAVTRAGDRIPLEAILMLQVEADRANARQREIFQAVRQARSDKRNAAQADVFRAHLTARRAARAARLADGHA